MRLWSAAALALTWVGHAAGQEGFRPPVYTEALWLPENFVPAGFTADEDRPKFPDPPRSNGSQRIAIRVPRPDGSGHDNWIWCYIDGMMLHRSAEDARGFVAWLVRPQGDAARSFRRVSLGDEAYIDEGRLRGYLGQDNISYADAGGFLIKENVSDNRQGGAIVGGSIWRRNLLVDPVRVGRMTVGLRVEGMAISQSAHGKWEIVRPVPTGEELVTVARKVVAAIDAYASSRGWVGGESSRGAPVARESGGGVVSGPKAVDGGDDAVATDEGFSATGSVAVGAVAVGALTALGAGLMMLGMGVGPRELIEGAREWFGGGASETTAPREPLTEAQRGAVVDILSRDWENVSPEELELLRTSPKWLKEAMQQTVPAVTIEEYQKSLWREGAVAGLKAAQSYIDAAVGIFSSATGNLPMAVHYTYFKNMLGGTSEGVADWAWGNNKRGLVRNVAEGFTRGSIKGGVELAVDFAAGKAISNPVAEYAAGQVAKYAVGAAGDAATDYLSPPNSEHRPLRAEGFFDTTSPVEKAALDAVTGAISDLAGSAGGGGPAPRLPHMAHSLER